MFCVSRWWENIGAYDNHFGNFVRPEYFNVLSNIFYLYPIYKLKVPINSLYIVPNCIVVMVIGSMIFHSNPQHDNLIEYGMTSDGYGISLLIMVLTTMIDYRFGFIQSILFMLYISHIINFWKSVWIGTIITSVSLLFQILMYKKETFRFWVITNLYIITGALIWHISETVCETFNLPALGFLHVIWHFLSSCAIYRLCRYIYNDHIPKEVDTVTPEMIQMITPLGPLEDGNISGHS